MIAAAARTSGTTPPAASVLYCGVIASCSSARLRSRARSRARADARARARFARRAFEALAEYAVAGFLVVDALRAVVALRVAEDFFCVPSAAWTGRQRPTPSSVVTTRTTRMGRIRPKSHPLDITKPFVDRRICWVRPAWRCLVERSQCNNKLQATQPFIDLSRGGYPRWTPAVKQYKVRSRPP